MRRVLLLGDSILQGITIDPATNRYILGNHFDWNQIEDCLDIKIKNLSRMGATITYGFNKLKSYLSEHPEIDIVVIEFGGNDCDYVWRDVVNSKSKDISPKTPLNLFKKTLIELIAFLKEKNIKPILMSLPVISSIKYYNWILKDVNNEENLIYFLGDKDHISRHHEMYNQVILDVAKQTKTEIVDVRKTFLETSNYQNLICDDGIHINAEGARLMTDIFIKHFKPRKI